MVGKRPRRDDSRRGARWAASYVTLLNICLSRSQSHTHSRSSFHPVRCEPCQQQRAAASSSPPLLPKTSACVHLFSYFVLMCACNLISCAQESRRCNWRLERSRDVSQQQSADRYWLLLAIYSDGQDGSWKPGELIVRRPQGFRAYVSNCARIHLVL